MKNKNITKTLYFVISIVLSASPFTFSSASEVNTEVNTDLIETFCKKLVASKNNLPIGFLIKKNKFFRYFQKDGDFDKNKDFIINQGEEKSFFEFKDKFVLSKNLIIKVQDIVSNRIGKAATADDTIKALCFSYLRILWFIRGSSNQTNKLSTFYTKQLELNNSCCQHSNTLIALKDFMAFAKNNDYSIKFSWKENLIYYACFLFIPQQPPFPTGFGLLKSSYSYLYQFYYFKPVLIISAFKYLKSKVVNNINIWPPIKKKIDYVELTKKSNKYANFNILLEVLNEEIELSKGLERFCNKNYTNLLQNLSSYFVIPSEMRNSSCDPYLKELTYYNIPLSGILDEKEDLHKSSIFNLISFICCSCIVVFILKWIIKNDLYKEDGQELYQSE